MHKLNSKYEYIHYICKYKAKKNQIMILLAIILIQVRDKYAY